jgi:hypothetical protein
MPQEDERTARFKRGLTGLARTPFWLGVWILPFACTAASAQTTYLPASLSSGTYQATATLTNCTGLGPPPTGCTGSALGIDGQVILEAGSKIVLGPGFTANATNSSTSLIALTGASNYVPVTITTAPATGLQLTVDSAPCTSPCTYPWIPNYNHTIAAVSPQTEPGGIQFRYLGWSDGGSQAHSLTAPSSAATYTATLQPTAPPAPLALSSLGLKGLGEYFPRGHAWWSMLYDWYTLDCTTTTLPQSECSSGQYVYQLVQNDLQNVLKPNGINFIHLYLWDQDIAQAVLEPVWQAYTAYNLGYEIQDTNGHLQKVTQAGTSGALPPNPCNLTSGVCTYPGRAPTNWNFDFQTTADGTVVWTDQGLMLAGTGPETSLAVPGFMGWDNIGPEASPGNPAAGTGCPACNQWSALQAFLSLAHENGISVALEFASARPAIEANLPPTGLGEPSSVVGNAYGAWVSRFIGALQAYQNVVLWGPTYGIPQPPSDPFWGGGGGYAGAYAEILAALQTYPYTSPPGRALLLVASNFAASWPAGPPVQPILSGYQWNWQAAQQQAYDWQYYLNYGSGDKYAYQMYNPNAGDLQAALEFVDGTPAQTCGSSKNQPCPTVPYSQMIVTEAATGSSFEQPPIGNGLASFGDVQTPTSSAAGHAQWLTDTLCALGSSPHDIPATGWYGLYDSASWWEHNLNYSGAQLAWNAYWGLLSEYSTYNTYGSNGIKPAWTAFLGYPGNCPSPSSPPMPVLALTSDATYYTVGNPATITWGAADVTSISLTSQPVAGISSCGTGTSLSGGTSLLGSCAYATVTMPSTPQQVTITLNGSNTDVDGIANSGLTTCTAPACIPPSVTLTVGAGPTIDHVVNDTTNQICYYSQNPTCAISATQLDTISIFGAGFDSAGGNTVQFTAGGNTYWLYSGDNYYYWDASPQQINAQIGCYITQGVWTFDVWNPHQQSPSSSHSVSVAHNSSGCP